MLHQIASKPYPFTISRFREFSHLDVWNVADVFKVSLANVAPFLQERIQCRLEEV